jgi:hypothetical protein
MQSLCAHGEPGDPLRNALTFSGGAKPQNWGGGGDLRGKLTFWGQDNIFKKTLLFAHAFVTGHSTPPPPGDSLPPFKMGAIFLGINLAPGGRIF